MYDLRVPEGPRGSPRVPEGPRGSPPIPHKFHPWTRAGGGVVEDRAYDGKRQRRKVRKGEAAEEEEEQLKERLGLFLF